LPFKSIGSSFVLHAQTIGDEEHRSEDFKLYWTRHSSTPGRIAPRGASSMVEPCPKVLQSRDFRNANATSALGWDVSVRGGSLPQIDVRKGMPPVKLSQDEFEKRYRSPFIDPVFKPLDRELRAIVDAAWDA
jgi:hypothetical protein